MISQRREAYKILLLKWKSACLLRSCLMIYTLLFSSFSSKILARVGMHKPTICVPLLWRVLFFLKHIWRVRWVDDKLARDQPRHHVTSARASDQLALAFGGGGAGGGAPHLRPPGQRPRDPSGAAMIRQRIRKSFFFRPAHEY